MHDSEAVDSAAIRAGGMFSFVCFSIPDLPHSSISMTLHDIVGISLIIRLRCLISTVISYVPGATFTSNFLWATCCIRASSATFRCIVHVPSHSCSSLVSRGKLEIGASVGRCPRYFQFSTVMVTLKVFMHIRISKTIHTRHSLFQVKILYILEIKFRYTVEQAGWGRHCSGFFVRHCGAQSMMVLFHPSLHQHH